MKINPITPVSPLPQSPTNLPPAKQQRVLQPITSVRVPISPEKLSTLEEGALRVGRWVEEKGSHLAKKGVQLAKSACVKAVKVVKEEVPLITKKVIQMAAKSATKIGSLTLSILKSPVTHKLMGPVATVTFGAAEIYRSDNKIKSTCEVLGEFVGTSLATGIAIATTPAVPVAVSIYTGGSLVLGLGGRKLGAALYNAVIGKEKEFISTPVLPQIPTAPVMHFVVPIAVEKHGSIPALHEIKKAVPRENQNENYLCDSLNNPLIEKYGYSSVY